MKTLIEGYRHFRETYLKWNQPLFKLLATGQAPQAMVIGCCDSRVEPALIFSAPPGEIFTLRNIANLVPPYEPDGTCHGTSAAIEFAVKALKIKDIIVMGHSGCGGVKALLDGRQGEFVGPWMRIATEAWRHVLRTHDPHDPEALQERCEQENIRVSLRNLRSYPWVAEAEAKGVLGLHGWYFAIEQGRLFILDRHMSDFVDPLEPRSDFHPDFSVMLQETGDAKSSRNSLVALDMDAGL